MSDTLRTTTSLPLAEATILALVSLVMLRNVSTSYDAAQTHRDKVFAFTTATSILAELHAMVDRLCAMADLPKPRVAIIPTDMPNAFALGGAVTATGGVVLSTFLTMDASIGVVFTMKALIIVIMGGVGDVRGAIIASLILGLAETAVASLLDPGLTLAAAYLLFVLVLLLRPEGLFGRRLS